MEYANGGDLHHYLQNKFKPNMTFDNYGEWEVDHIVAFSKFDFNNEEDIKTCCNYQNLQPLWLSENRKKYNK